MDTSALMLGLGVSDNHDQAALCRRFLDEADRQGTTMLVAAPSIAELRRRRSRIAFTELPRVRSLVPIAFNAEHAHRCGDLFPWPQGEPEIPQSRTKFDLMIVASAADIHEEGSEFVFVTCDSNQAGRAAQAGLNVASPWDYEPRQLDLLEASGPASD